MEAPGKWIQSLFRSKSANVITQRSKISYKPLGDQEIRLFQILPGSKSEIIRCSIRNVSLEDESLDFVALSWVWGPEPTTFKQIVMNDEVITITPKLHELLSALRQNHSSQDLWIDGISVNQTDTEEKNVQIPLMSQVFSKSSTVLVWLGPPTGQIKYVLENVNRPVEELDKAKCIIGALEILNRPWWSRTWVVQEFALNTNDPLFYFGRDYYLTWDDLYEFALANALLDNEHSDNTDNSWMLHQWKAMRMMLDWVLQRGDSAPDLMSFETGFVGIRGTYHNPEAFPPSWRSFIHILKSVRAFQVTDQRDKIYGIIGLLDDHDREELLKVCPVDYNKSLERIHQELAVYFLTVANTIAFFENYQIVTDMQPVRPSWVPDFSKYYRNNIRLADDDTRSEGELQPISITPDYLKMTVSGIVLDQIDDLNGPCISAWENEEMPLPPEYNLWRKLSRTFGGTILKHLELGIYMIHQKSSLCKTIIEFEDILNDKGKHLVEPIWKTLLASEATLDKYGDNEDEYELAYSEFKSMKDSKKFGDLSDRAIEIAWILLFSLSGRFLFCAEKEWYGIAEKGIKKGDQLVLLFPDQYVPFIIRPKGDFFEIVSVAYVPPKLREEALQRLEEDPMLKRQFTFV